MPRTVTILWLLVWPAWGWAQPVEDPNAAPLLTLEQALALALANGFAVQSAALEVQIAEDDVSAAKTQRLPLLQVMASETRHLTAESFRFEEGAFGDFPATGPIPPTDTRIGTQPRWATIAGVRAALPLSEQYEIGLGIREEEIGQGLAEEELRAARQQLAEEVKDTYFGIGEIEATLAAIRESIVFLEELDQLVDRYVEAETALKYESLEVKTRLAEARQAQLEERNDRATAKEELNRLMGRPLETAFRIETGGDAPVPRLDAVRARADALAERPDVRAARLAVERAETGYRLGFADFIPEINLVASYLKPFDVKLIPDEYSRIAFELEWEFFTWGRRIHQLDARRGEILKARNRLHSIEARVTLEVNEKLRTLEEAVARVPVAELAQRSAHEKLRVMMNRYREHTVLLQRVLEAESDLAAANADQAVSRLQVRAAQADLERATGRE